MIAFTYRPHWYSLRKATISRTSFAECTTDEVLAIFRYINSAAVSLEDKMLLAEWVDGIRSTPIFPLKSLKGFCAPADNLKGMSIGQWAYVERYAFEYSQNPSVKTKAKLLSCIYLKPGSKFSPEEAEKNERRFRRVSTQALQASVHCWNGVRQWGYDQYPHVFPKRKMEEGEESMPATAPEYGKLIISLSDGNSDRAIDDIFNSSLHNILFRLDTKLSEKK